MFKKGSRWYKNEAVAEEYDDRRFTRGGQILDRREKETLLSLLEPEGKKILDIATGTGRFAEFLESEGAEVIGVDASREMLRSGKADYMVGDALSLPFKEKVFDQTISMRFLHLLGPEQIDEFIKEVSRVTKEKFVFETLHPMSIRLLYQWALPQDSSLYSNSFLRDCMEEIPEIKKIDTRETLSIPYGIYQLLPYHLAKSLSSIDKKLVDSYNWTASTVYWEVYF